MLIVTGQHTAENIGFHVTAASNPLNTGLVLIWSGNVIVAIAGAVLIVRLQRQ